MYRIDCPVARATSPSLFKPWPTEIHELVNTCFPLAIKRFDKGAQKNFSTSGVSSPKTRTRTDGVDAAFVSQPTESCSENGGIPLHQSPHLKSALDSLNLDGLRY